MILRAVYTKTDLVEILSPRSWNSGDTRHPPYSNYFLATMCGCKSCDGIQDEHKTLCNQRQSHCIRRRMAKSTATERALSLDRIRFVSCFQLRLWRQNGNEKFSPRFALGDDKAPLVGKQFFVINMPERIHGMEMHWTDSFFVAEFNRNRLRLRRFRWTNFEVLQKNFATNPHGARHHKQYQ